jgi:PKD repeat protein
MKHKLLLITLFLAQFMFAQSWQPVGGGTNNSSHGLLTWNGKLIDLGSFNNPCNRVAQWDGANWTCLAGGVGIVARAGVVWDGKLVVVGDFWNVNQPCVGCNGVAVWDGTSWTPLGNGVNNDVLSITVWNNQVVIAGDFTQANGVPIARIAKWNGTVWESVGPIGSFDNDIRAMVEYDGDLWVGGDFNNVGGNSAYDGLVKYDPDSADWVGGNSGVDLIGGVDESVRVLYINPNDGNLYMGGEFTELWDGDAAAADPNMHGIAMYDGSNWTPLGTGLNEYCRAIHEYNGDIVAGGYFTAAGGVPANKIARWNGSAWAPMGLGFDAVGIDEYVKSATVWNGTFFAGGAYTQAEGNPMDYISQWYEPPAAAPVAWMTASATTLCGSGCIYFLDNSTNNPTSWNWSFPGSNTPTSTAQHPGSVCYSAPGNYTVTLQACNAIGCTTQDIDIEVTSGATLTVLDQHICDGGSATLVAVPSIPGGSFLWSTSETTPSITVSPLVNTNYTVSYAFAGCNAGPISATVTVGTTPLINLNVSDSIICAGEIVSLTTVPSASGGTYLWSPGGANTASIIVSPAVTTTYTAEYTLNGCTSIPDSITVTVNPAPVITTSTTGNQIIADQNSASYQWLDCNNNYFSITGETAQSFSPLTNGNYAVEIDLNGCTDTSVCIPFSGTGIKNLDITRLVIYPNPSTGWIYISADKTPLNFEITDLLGNILVSGKLSSADSGINISELSKGIYLFKSGKENPQISKIVRN